MKKTKKVINELKKISKNYMSNRDRIIEELVKIGFRKISPVDYVYDKKGGYKSIGSVRVKISQKNFKVSCQIDGITKESELYDVSSLTIKDMDDIIHKTFNELIAKIKDRK